MPNWLFVEYANFMNLAVRLFLQSSLFNGLKIVNDSFSIQIDQISEINRIPHRNALYCDHSCIKFEGLD